MSSAYAGYGRILPEDLPALRQDLTALGRFDGVIFFDPEEGLDPAFLAAEVRRIQPALAVVLPLVARDRNRTALLSAAHTAVAVGAAGLLLLSGPADRKNPARTVYELDPSQMLGFLREHGIGVELWASSRCSTAAERTRVRSFAELGASRCLVPWSAADPSVRSESLVPVFSVAAVDWAGGRLPPEDTDRVLLVSPGRAGAAADALAPGAAS